MQPGDLDRLPLPSVVLSADGRVAAFNRRAAAMFAGDPAGHAADELLGPSLRDGERVHAWRLNGVPFSADAHVTLRGDGTRLVLLCEIAGQQLLDESQRWLHVAFETAPIGMGLFDTDGRYVRTNDALCLLLGRPATAVIGRRDQTFTHPDDRQSDVDAAWRILRGELDTWQTEKRFLRPDGSVVWAIASLSFLRDDAGRPLCWLGQFQDITDRRRREERLRHLADHDELTGVANRRRLLRELAARMQHARRSGDRGAVLLLDLDGFKDVNDRRGHDAGDRLLVRVARMLAERLRAADLVGRLGGDEFAVVLGQAGEEQARAVAQELIEAVRSACGGAVSASCGIALFGPEAPAQPDDVLAAADRAMYAAKAGGRDSAVLLLGY